MNLFLDSETTGIPPKNSDWRKDFHDYPFLCSIAWKFGNTERNFIVHSKTVKVPVEAFKVHGISTAALRESKTDFVEVCSLLIEDCKKVDKIIGFNIYFDTSIIKANAMRLAGNIYTIDVDHQLRYERRVDVMRIAAAKLFKNKWPTLSRLYEHLFEDDFNAHDALEDVKALEMCYNEMKKRKLIK